MLSEANSRSIRVRMTRQPQEEATSFQAGAEGHYYYLQSIALLTNLPRVRFLTVGEPGENSR